MRSRRLVLLATTAAIAAGALAGCVPGGDEPQPSPTPSTSGPSASPTSTPSPTPTPTETIIPFSIDCETLLPPDVVYAFDPNFSFYGAVQPDAGTVAAQAVAAGGVVCRWVHGTSGITLDVSVAELSPAAATARKNDLVQSSNSVPTYGVEGYFRVNGNSGEAQAFPDPYWVSMVSPAFFEPGDVSPLMDAAIAALG